MAHSQPRLADINKLGPGQLNAAQKGRLAQLLANPGTRRLVADKFLTSAQRQQRGMNVRLAQPIVPGSNVTERDLAHQTKAATQVKYGPQESQLNQNLTAAQQVGRDTGDYYDAYLRELAAHQKNVGDYQSQAQQAVQNIGQAGTGLGNGAAAGVSADNATDASNASAVRQALTGSFGALLASQGAGANTYADTLAHVVGPGQKLQALKGAAGQVGKIRQDLANLKSDEGSYREQLAGQARSDEGKNVLATQALLGTQATQAAQNAKTTAQTTKTQADIDYFNKHGYYPRTGPAPKPKAPTGYGAGAPGLNKYGYTYDEWTALGPKAQAAARAGKGKPKKPVDPATQYAKDFYAKYGVKPASTSAVGAAKTQISSAGTWVDTVLKSNPNMGENELGQLLVRGQAGDKKAGSVAIPKQQALWVRVALDRKFHSGLITAGTADRLHRAGYSVKVLGLSTGDSSSSTYAHPPKTATTGSRGDG